MANSLANSPPASVSVAHLAERHHRLRAQVPWLLAVGVALLLALAAAWLPLPLPRRVALTGYRLRQVGVRADGTRWLLAERAGRAELLFSPADTSRGWQRHGLGVAADSARRLALDWGGKALLVGNNGEVQVYDSLLRPIDSLYNSLNAMSRPVWRNGGYMSQGTGPLYPQAVIADNLGLHAVVIGANGQVYITIDGGSSWSLRQLSPDPTALTDTIEAGVAGYLSGSSTRFVLASRRQYHVLDVTRFNSGWSTIHSAHKWAKPFAEPLAWCGRGPDGLPRAFDRGGHWAGPDTAGVVEPAQSFFGKTLGVASLDTAGQFLGVDTTGLGLYQYQVAGFLRAVRRPPRKVAKQAAPATPPGRGTRKRQGSTAGSSKPSGGAGSTGRATQAKKPEVVLPKAPDPVPTNPKTGEPKKDPEPSATSSDNNLMDQRSKNSGERPATEKASPAQRPNSNLKQ